MIGTYRWDAIGALVVTSLAIMGTPGPATISLTAAGSAYGVRRSLSYLTGIIAGTTIVLLAVATGITAALLALPAVRPVLLAAGAAYIVWLAYHIATAPPLAAEGSRSDAPGLVGGTLLGIANP
ncbi:MAG: LysE family translocator, partial [Gaiellales bacterium]